MGYRNRILSHLDSLDEQKARARAAMVQGQPDNQECWYALVDALAEIQGAMAELLSDGFPQGSGGEQPPVGGRK